MNIINDAQLQAELNSKLEIVINNVADRLVDKLKDIIEETVYKSYEPTFYNRQETGNFKESWTHELPIIHNDMVTALVYQDYNSLMVDLENWVHGSIYSGELEENGLNDIINYGKIGNMANFPQPPKLGARPFWDKFQGYVDKELGNIFQQECARVGLQLSPNNMIFQFN